MKVLILGSTGMLGNAVAKYFIKTNYDVYTTYRNQKLKFDSKSFYFDPLISTFESLKGFDYIINCIGTIKPFVKKENMKDTVFLNSLFPRQLSDFSEASNTKLIHITTDCVYSGKSGEYDENSLHDCLDEYGKSKSLGEPHNCMVIRTSIIGDEIHKNASLIAWVKSNAGMEINGFVNHIWNGITTTQYAEICHQIIEKDLFSRDLYHVFSNDVTKHELVEIINHSYKLNIKINPIHDKMSINRTLRTIKSLNHKLSIPSIDEQIKVIANFQKENK